MVAIAGGDPETTAEPQCGYYKRRLVRGGPWIPCRIWLFQDIDEVGELLDDERLQAECNGAWADPDDLWSFVAANPITEAEFKFLSATIEWTQSHAPHEPMANPRQAVDWTAVPTPTF
jgi:hypothetical protein